MGMWQYLILSNALIPCVFVIKSQVLRDEVEPIAAHAGNENIAALLFAPHVSNFTLWKHLVGGCAVLIELKNRTFLCTQILILYLGDNIFAPLRGQKRF